MNIKLLKAAFVGLVLSVSSFANASVIYSVDSGWGEFNWDGGVGTSTNEGGFTFELVNDAVLTVVDAFAFGDEFEIFINGVLDSNTSDVALFQAINVGPDADLALSSGFSQGTVSLSAGLYLIDFRLFQDGLSSVGGAPFSSGSAYFKVESTSVSAPSVLALFALGLIGLSARRFKK